VQQCPSRAARDLAKGPVMSVLNRIACIAGRHERSRSKADLSGPEARSVCRHCGVAMVKHGGTWQVETEEAAHSSGT
jgi:hypothetical protein